MKNLPKAVNKYMVGKYPVLTCAGGGYFYDEVLEYRVWVHPKKGKSDYFSPFEDYERALDFSTSTTGAEPPLVLILQGEHVNEPEPGIFIHVKKDRLTELNVEWLKGHKRKKNSIDNFLKKHKKNTC